MKDILIFCGIIITGAVLVALLMITLLYNAQYPSSIELGPADIAKMASPGNHCIESVKGGGWRFTNGDCFNVDSEGNIKFIYQTCTGVEFCAFQGLRRMPTQEEIEK
jgi:hypothetical protein